VALLHDLLNQPLNGLSKYKPFTLACLDGDVYVLDSKDLFKLTLPVYLRQKCSM
jgi:hypothetical protein